MDLEMKILELKKLLESRENQSSVFFNTLLKDLKNGFKKEVIDTIIKSYAIVQYGDFNKQEEKIFDEIWEFANTLHS